MARNELAYAAKAWKDFQSGGTRVNAEDLNNMEAGIADATAAINAVNATVLTYLVAEAGDTATTDLNGAAITGPCYVEDLSNGNRWLDKGDGTARVRTGVSVKEYEALRDSVSRKAAIGNDRTRGAIVFYDDDANFSVTSSDGTTLTASFNEEGVSLWKNGAKVWQIPS